MLISLSIDYDEMLMESNKTWYLGVGRWLPGGNGLDQAVKPVISRLLFLLTILYRLTWPSLLVRS